MIDCWWEVQQSLHAAGWLGELPRDCPRVVLVTPASIPVSAGFNVVQAPVVAQGDDPGFVDAVLAHAFVGRG